MYLVAPCPIYGRYTRGTIRPYLHDNTNLASSAVSTVKKEISGCVARSLVVGYTIRVALQCPGSHFMLLDTLSGQDFRLGVRTNSLS
jgi:hypothetical protein